MEKNLKKYIYTPQFPRPCLTLLGPHTVACQAPLSMRFPRQEDWNGLPFPSPGDLPDPGIEPTCTALASKFFTTESPGKPQVNIYINN